MSQDRRRTWIPTLGTSIRWRLTFATAIPVLIVLTVAGALLVKETRERYAQVARERAWTHLAPLAVPCARAMAVHALDRLDGYLAEAVNVRTEGVRLLDARIYDSLGDQVASVVAGDFALPKEGAASEDSLEVWRRQALRSDTGSWLEKPGPNGTLQLHVSVPTISALRWGTLFATFDVSGIHTEAQRTQAWMIGLILLVTLTLMFTLRLALAQMVVFPVDELARTAGSIRDGQLDARAWVPGHDELGRLARDFNAMATELETYTHSLELKVEERTAEVRRKQRELERVNDRLADAVEELERLATIDGLTGVFNRRHFDETLAFEFRRGERSPHPFCVIMIDVDHFKVYNDTNGHQEGDVALQLVAKLLGEHLRGTDFLARYGGEEFVALLLDTPKESGLRVAEGLRAAIAMADFPCGAKQPMGRVTASMGVAAWPSDARGPDEVLECADRSLYAAKRLGRNRVMGFGPAVVETEDESRGS
ncbi:MAG: diguanylate cyclase [Myxococcales bacterium]|nr:diguanylate cyclase [Myxococcales bacterium]